MILLSSRGGLYMYVYVYDRISLCDFGASENELHFLFNSPLYIILRKEFFSKVIDDYSAFFYLADED